MNIKEQSELAVKIGQLLLEDFLALLQGEKEITSTDRATIARFLMANGFTVDPRNIPEELKSMLTSDVKFDETDNMPMRVVK